MLDIATTQADLFDDSSDWGTVMDDTSMAAAQDENYDSSSYWETAASEIDHEREKDKVNGLSDADHDKQNSMFNSDVQHHDSRSQFFHGQA